MSAFAEEDLDIYQEESEPVLSVPAGGEDWDGAQDAKDKANEAKANGNYDQAVEHFTKCLELGSISAITLANRADCLLKMRRPLAALSDCNEALKINPDSAKAMRCRGIVERHLGQWEAANTDLAAAQRIDFNPDAEEMRTFVNKKAVVIIAEQNKARQAKEEEEREILREKVRLQREAIAAAKKEQEEQDARDAAERAEREASMGGMPGGMGGMPGGMGGMPGGMGGMPGGMGGMPGGMGGMPGGGGGGGGMPDMQQMMMQLLMSDPELAAGLQNPKIMQAFQDVMAGGGPTSPAAAAAMEDPEVKSFMDKFQKKMGPLMGMMGGGMGGMPGGMGGMPGGMGGMPGGMGGMPGGMGGMPGMDEVDEDSDDDMPDLTEADGPAVEEVD